MSLSPRSISELSKEIIINTPLVHFSFFVVVVGGGGGGVGAYSPPLKTAL